MTYITVSYLVVNLLHQSAECSCGNPQLFFSVRHSWGTSDSFFVFWIGTEDPTEGLGSARQALHHWSYSPPGLEEFIVK